MSYSQFETRLKALFLLLVLFLGVISCGQKNFSTIDAFSDDTTPVAIDSSVPPSGVNFPAPSNSNMSTLVLSSSNQKDGAQNASYIKSQMPSSQYAHLKLAGFSASSNTIYGCLSHNNSVNCDLPASFAQVYPAVSDTGWVLDGNFLRSAYDLSNLPIGSYKFVFRKDSTDVNHSGQVSLTVTVSDLSDPPVSPSPSSPVTSNPPPNVSSGDSSYLPLVSRYNSSFQSRFAPGSPSVGVDNGKVSLSLISLGSTDGSMRVTKFKIFIPPGTTRFKADAYLYVDGFQTPAKGAIKFKSPPQSNKDQVTNTSAQGQNQTMLTLLQGNELLFYSPGATLPLYPRDSEFKATEGGYVYINILDAPGGIIMGLEAYLTIDQACYESWYANARFDSGGNPVEGASHTCAGTSP